MTSIESTPTRPAIVLVAVVLVFLSGLSNVGVGLLVLLSRYQVPSDVVLPVSLLGAGVILMGLLTLAVASAIARGSRLARLLLTAYLGMQLVLHVVTIVTTEWDGAAAGQAAVEALIIAALWAPPGSRHFRHR